MFILTISSLKSLRHYLKIVNIQYNLCAYTVINAFGGLVILRAIAGNITSYSREIYGQLKSLL